MPQSIRKLLKVWRSEDYGSKAIAHHSEPHQIGGAFLLGEKTVRLKALG